MIGVRKELQLWQFILERLYRGESAMLLVVAESAGSSPGRHGYKMAVGSDGGLSGSIGGGVMEVNLVEESRRLLARRTEADYEVGSLPPAVASGYREQVHRRDTENSSGMICSGRQTVIHKLLTPGDATGIVKLLEQVTSGNRVLLELSRDGMAITADAPAGRETGEFVRLGSDFKYTEILGHSNRLYIVGGGHCALALSELMSSMDFRISLFDDRPDLNTISKNQYAHEIKIVDSYERIGDHIGSGRDAYVVVMTLGYKTDALVIRGLLNKEFKYFGVLGSKAKMAAMFKSLREEGIDETALARIRTPIGLPINSRTPEEIAVSIAAEIISVKNAEP